MNKEIGIAALKAVISSGKESQSSIAKRLGIDASQVSKIASGNFKRMSGHALKVCKFALKMQAHEHVIIKNPELTEKLNFLTEKFVDTNPSAAQALIDMLEILIGRGEEIDV